MPTAPVNSEGVVLYYDDTGAPESSTTYVTIVLVHGTAIHSGIFKPLKPYAVQNNVRLVLLNLRDYSGSTAYSSDELEAIRSPSHESQAAVLQARALELVAFLSLFVKHEKIPPIAKVSESPTVTGGIALLGWSGGNYQTLPVLSHADKVTEDTKLLLDSYFRSLIVYDAALYAIGASPPEGLYNPLRDQSLTVAERVAAFPLWVSTYYPQVENLSTDLSSLVSTLKVRQTSTAADRDTFVPTIQTMSARDLDEIVDLKVMNRSQLAIMSMHPSVYAENFRRALCYAEERSKEQEIVWSALKVQVVWCDMSHGDAVATAQMIRDEYAQYHGTGQKARPLQLFQLQKANHFAHWDQPESFVQFLASIV
ncbi:hypothetical protein BKA93DRAFT_157576 [Sparassis latifolia]